MPPEKNVKPAEQLFFDTALKPVNDLADEVILFSEPKSEASRAAAKRSHDRLAMRTTDLDTPIPQPLAARLMAEASGEDLFSNRFGTLDKLKRSRVPILVISGDHDIIFPVENWYALNQQLPTTQHIVFPQAGHGPQHEHPEACVDQLPAAAHAGCFTMALSLILGEAKLTAERMETSAKVTLEQVDGDYAITAVHLTLKAKIPGADQTTFEKLSSMAKAGCPVSKLFKAEITLDATLVS